MVQVDRPQRQMAAGNENVDSQAITQDAIQPPHESESEPLAAAATTGSNRFLESDALDARPREPHDELGAGPPDPAWESPQTQRSRQIGLVIALSACSLVIAFMLFGWFVRAWSSRAGKDQTVQLDSNVSLADAAASDPQAIDRDAKSLGVAQATGDEDTPPDEAEELGDELAASEGLPAEDSVPPLNQHRREDSTPAPAPNVDSPIIPANLLAPSPLIPSSVFEEPPPPGNHRPSGLQDLPAGLAEFTNLIDLANDGGITKPTLEAPPSMNAQPAQIEGPAEEAIDPMMIAAPPGPINMRRGLAVPLAIAPRAPEGYPLADLVLLLSQVTGIPIQLDWVSFDLAGRDIRAPVKTSQGWKPVGEILAEVAIAVDAELDQGETMILISPSEESFAIAVQSVLDLEDFGGEAASAAEVINRFLSYEAERPTAPNDINSGTTRPEHQLAMLATETLRRMRDIPTKVSPERLARWTQAAEQQADTWQPLVGGKSGPQYDAPVAITEVLRRVARENQASCIVNWSDARRRRMAPEQLTLPFAGTDGGQQLAGMLAPFQMQVRQVDDQHWWIGTEATYDRLPLVVWTKPLGDSRDAFVQRISAIMAGADQDTFRIAIDPMSDRAMLVLPRFIVRQLTTLQLNVAVR